MKINTASSSGSGTLPSNTITNPKEYFKGITTRSGNACKGPTVPTTSPPPKVVERETEPVVAFVTEPVVAPISAPKPNLKSSIPYPSRLHDQKLRAKANDQKEKIFKIFQDLDFNISFADALILMPKFGPTIKSLLTNKEKLFELARTPLNEHCSAVLLKKLPKKLGDPKKFLIPCDFSGMNECLALADLGASINLMPLSVWNKLFLSELSPTCMTLELADRSISRPVEVVEDVFVKVGTFHFLADFVVIDFDVDPRVPLILGRSFLETGHTLIDVYEGELTLRVGKEAVTFNLDQTSRYFANSDAMLVNRIDLINVACEEYSQEVLGFFVSGNPTPSMKPIVSTSSPTLTPFGDSNFFLEETDAFLAIDDEQISPKINEAYYDSEGDIILLEEFLNDDPSSPPLPPQELKVVEPTNEKSSIDEPPVVELKDLKDEKKTTLIKVLNGSAQRRVKPKIHEVIKMEVLRLLDAGLIYPISDSPWVSTVHCVPKKGGFTVVENEENELIPTRLFTGWHVCIDYQKLNDATHPQDQEKTTFTCLYGTFAYRRMPFGLCNAPAKFQRCMISIFHDMIEKMVEVFMDDFSVFGNSFGTCLSYLDKMLKRCEDTNLCLNWEKSYFMVKESIVLGHKISKNGIEVDKAKVDVIAKLPHPTTVKGICSFFGHADFYRRFIQYFSKIARPMTRLLEKDTPFFFSKECIEAFQTLKKKLTEAPILVAPDWDLPFELMCDLSDFAIVAVLGQRKTKYFQPIHYASKTMTDAQAHYTTTEKELLAVVYVFEKFLPYLVLSKSIVYTNHSALKYLFNKRDAKPRLVRFGTPRDIISDCGTYFCNDQFAKVMLKYGVTYCLATSYHPQTSGQVEVSSRGLKRILERTVGENRASWSDKL
nr:reverse transcriptase domain-containing protein [Tanacetum cinerariifolium]